MDAQLWTYLVAITLLTITPGVDTVMIIRNTARGGWNDGAVTSLGICSGLFVHATVSAVGISVILLQSAWAFSALKLAGALYLIWLGFSSLRRVAARTQVFSLNADPETDMRFSFMRSFREGLLSNVLNPKAVIFYMAFLPHFIDPSQSALVQSLLLAGIHFLIAMAWQCLLASVVERAKGWLMRPRVSRVFDSITGSIMVLIGFKLVIDR